MNSARLDAGRFGHVRYLSVEFVYWRLSICRLAALDAVQVACVWEALEIRIVPDGTCLKHRQLNRSLVLVPLTQEIGGNNTD